MSAYGLGYAWSIPFLTVKKGDYVKWNWYAPPLIALSFKVEQVRNALSEEAIGFTSGESTETGSYLYQFNEIGTFYYWYLKLA